MSKGIKPPDVSLRLLEPGDIPALFDFHADSAAIHMAGAGSVFADAIALGEHFETVQKNGALVRVILCGAETAGYVASFERFGKREISYWIGRDFWGKGIATKAVSWWLEEFPPIRSGLYARVVDGNLASARVLEKCGFTAFGRDSFFSDIRNAEIEETLYKYNLR